MLLGLAGMLSSGAPRTMFSPAARPVYVTSQPVASPRSPAPQAMELPYALLAEIVDAGGERVYGAVDAPGWVAPIGGLHAPASRKNKAVSRESVSQILN